MNSVKQTEWRLSGKDGQLHAFRAEGGYVSPKSLISVGFPTDDSESSGEVFGPYEGVIAECGHIVPVAMLLCASTSESCVACLATTGALTPRRTTRDWQESEPLRRRVERPAMQPVTT
jgi:hypothetical protein